MSDDLEPVDRLHKASFVEGQRAVANDITSQRLKEHFKTLGEVGDVAAETLDQAERIAQSGDPHKAKLANILKDRIVGAVDDMTSGRPPAEEAREAAQASPLLENSGPTATSLPSSPPKVLEHRPSEPPKKKRGRPPKNTKG